MDTAQKMQLPRVSKRRLAAEMVALLLFFVVGFLAASPCLCPEGAVAGTYKLAFFLLVFVRLAWSVYRHTFRFVDYFVYFALVIGFCIWVESRF
jgi:hypothetical protein